MQTQKKIILRKSISISPSFSHTLTDSLLAQDVTSSGFFGMLRILDEALFELVALVPHPL